MADWELSEPLRAEHIEMFRRFARLGPVLGPITATPLPSDIRDQFAEVRARFAPGRPAPPEIAALMPGIRLAGPLPLPPVARLLEALGYVEEGLAAAHYHSGRVEELERNIARVCKAAMIKQGVQAETMGFRSPVLGFEYHAFLFALRRSLDYLAVGVAAYFKHHSNSIRRLGRALERAEPREEAQAVRSVLSAALPQLKSILSEGDDRSVRDRVAHWQVVDAGFFNVRWDSKGNVVIELIGGGEELPPFSSVDAESAPLTSVLREQLSIAQDLVFDVVTALGDSKD